MPCHLRGCYYCFDTLNAQDEQENLHQIYQCSGCGVLYHVVCWDQEKECLRCGGNSVEPVQVSSTRTQTALRKTNALPIQPSGLIYCFGQYRLAVPDSVYRRLWPRLGDDSEFTQVFIIILIIIILDLFGCFGLVGLVYLTLQALSQ